MAKAIDYDEYEARETTPAGQATQALEFLTKHFVVLSAAAVTNAFLCAIIFLGSYLAVFDWRLIWVMEYSDIFKAGFSALGLLSTPVVAFQGIAAFLGMDDAKVSKKTTISVIIIVAILTFVLVPLLFLLTERPEVHIWISLSVMMLLIVGLRLRNILWLPTISTSYMIDSFLALTAATAIFGHAFANYTLHSEGFKYDVTLKNEKLENVGLVMVTSHHTILYSNDRPIVVPSSEIIKLQARSTQPPKIECAAVEAC